jgi:hypothetical protein
MQLQIGNTYYYPINRLGQGLQMTLINYHKHKKQAQEEHEKGKENLICGQLIFCA